MRRSHGATRAVCVGGLVLLGLGLAVKADDDHVWHAVVMPEQRTIQVRDPAQLLPTPVPRTPTPRTVTDPQPETPAWNLSLDEAIRIALVNAKVIRVLAGITATASGSTIYDPAIANTQIDQEQARFDPVFDQLNTWNRIENPQVNIDPTNPTRATIGGNRVDDAHNETNLHRSEERRVGK